MGVLDCGNKGRIMTEVIFSFRFNVGEGGHSDPVSEVFLEDGV
jgi:hypothetical protein